MSKRLRDRIEKMENHQKKYITDLGIAACEQLFQEIENSLEKDRQEGVGTFTEPHLSEEEQKAMDEKIEAYLDEILRSAVR